MTPRARVFIGTVAALLVWMLGYGMGGGFRHSGKGSADSEDQAAAQASGAAGRQAGARNGVVRAAEDTLSDQIAARRIPWTRERLLESISAVHREPDRLHVIRFGMRFMEKLGLEDFPLAIEAIENAIQGAGRPGYSDENDTLREKLKELAIMRWSELKPEAAAEYLKQKPFDHFGGRTYEDMCVLCGVWAQSDPASAIAWAKTLPRKDGQQQFLIEFIITAAARRDVDATIALARSNFPDSIAERGIGAAISRAVGDRDPERNAHTIAELGDSTAVADAAGMWARKDHNAAMKWAEALPDGELRTNALSGVWRQFAEQHPAEAAKWLTEQGPDAPSYVAGAAEVVVRELAAKDHKEAARWAATLQQPDARSSAIYELASYYVRDFDQGVKWVDSLSGKYRDQAINNLVTMISGRWEAQSELATTIENAEIRRTTLRNVVDQWRGRDSDAAVEWLKTSPTLSEEDRQALSKKK